ncbi:SDR family oxidoreductase [Bradyrhizobium sp. U87765 SZCCT0131]|uniref:SDR family oxidoreductase n=1 Tax=unclassified Bradyrhizobium TaxID=2631580 RepID=UPI001BABBC8F|nr:MULTISPECIES: SDR family oxidoreductase [unclassified Bradyrhizobium]MBR1219408.1 SDR family oxidoreductase [Bradyrhizobium sp. U87765 SZCCT0131]MBR1262059.1 SDR family oxidoreductase [Bradyrhizobium sp. U87765 SZCCT0134]MBR1306088.1 SDR family oxidoreductase [Bradyrhizobium sp. U87765 SZCCT0110]MBR1317841.1 SDR family oxidoreductase [Bradyrhizobium sp. U87765 SZCCT0109]MBR1351543.1 SDR family oxidoreductase [Bradyrhizobium sp. U87765 SZCCT0048]
MDLGLNGKVALVLGAGGGLGRAIAVALAREGARVALADINAAALRDTADEIALLPRSVGDPAMRAMALPFDLADLAGLDRQVERVEHQLGGVDILVNNSGGPPPGQASGQDSAAWQRAFEAMVLPLLALTDRVLPGMRSRGFGRIITSTSSGVVAPIPNLAFSNALRATLLGWSKTLAAEVAADGVTANIVVPGRIATGRVRFLDQEKARRQSRTVDAVVDESTASIPLKRYGRPEEYADTVAYLASTRASYITGAVIRVDGGLLANI